MTRLLELIKKTEYSIPRLAKEIGISSTGLRNYTKDIREIPVSTAKKLAPILKVNWWELYED